MSECTVRVTPIVIRHANKGIRWPGWRATLATTASSDEQTIYTGPSQEALKAKVTRTVAFLGLQNVVVLWDTGAMKADLASIGRTSERDRALYEWQFVKVYEETLDRELAEGVTKLPDIEKLEPADAKARRIADAEPQRSAA